MKNKAIFIICIILISVLCSFGVMAKGESATSDFEGAADAIAEALKKGESSVDLSKYNVHKDEFSMITQYSEFSNGDVFWYPSAFEYRSDKETGIVKDASWENSFTKEEFEKLLEMQKDFYKHSTEAINLCFEYGMTDFEKILSAHDYINERTVYSLDDDYSYTAYSVFARNKGVCQGYAIAFKYLMDKVGVECHVVSSEKLDHAWNIVKLDGEYYHVDLTTDDPVTEYNTISIKHGRSNHEFLLCSDKALGKDISDLVIYGNMDLPKCTSTKYDNAFFKDVKGTIVNLKGTLYYVEPNEYINGARKVFCVKASEVLSHLEKLNNYKTHETYFTAEKAVYAISSHAGKIYCAVKDEIFILKDQNQTEEVCYTVGDIFGLYFEGDILHYGVYRKKSYAICDKMVEKNLDCVTGISVKIDKENAFSQLTLNVFVKAFLELDEEKLTVSFDGNKKIVNVKDVENGAIEFPVSISQVGESISEPIEIKISASGEEKVYKTTFKDYFDTVKTGEYDQKCKDVVKTLLAFGGVEKTDLSLNSLNVFELAVKDASDEIAFQNAEISVGATVSVNLRFSVIGNAEFKVNSRFESEKNGLYYTVKIPDISVYNFEDVFEIKSTDITVTFNVLGLLKQCDETVQSRVLSLYGYQKAIYDFAE